MKKLSTVFIFILVCAFICGCTSNSQNVVRIHIRANSNNSIDQEIKLVVRDSIVNYITPIIAECENSRDVLNVLSNNSEKIKGIADNILIDNGFEYVSNVRIANEYFPTRSYDGEVFSADFYDALIVELGSGKGDNWWCVAYPPLCFVGDEVGDGNIKYKSKILELINKYFR